jgi:NADPH:quinone reductase-like Zn-dependent oxidoreductase
MDESLIILGASGGVGTLAVQLAKRRGARVLAIASGKDGVALARRLGADEAIDGHQEDLAAAAQRFAPLGVNAVLALAGGAALEQCIHALHPGGRLAYPHGIEPEPEPGRHHGIDIIAYDATPGARELEILARELASGDLDIPIAGEYTLGQAAQAHERLAAGHVLGKLVLRVAL